MFNTLSFLILQTSFEFETSSLIRKKIISSNAIKWRKFKATSTSFYIYGKYKGKSPCDKYGID